MADLMEILRQKKNAMSRGKKTIKPEPGRNRYRILPGWRKGDPTFFHDFGQHFVKDAAGALKAVYMCVDKTFGRPCEVCNTIDRGIMSSTDDTVIEALKAAKASNRVLLNVLALDGDTPTEPQVLEVSPTVFTAILGLFEEWGEELIDPENGKDIVVTREGSGLSTKYTVQVAAKSQPVPPAALKKIANLDDFVAQESEEVARRALGAVSAVAGVLPASVGDRPSKPAASDWGSSSGSIIDADADEAELRGLETSSAAKPAAAAPASALDSSEIDSILDSLEDLPGGE